MQHPCDPSEGDQCDECSQPQREDCSTHSGAGRNESHAYANRGQENEDRYQTQEHHYGASDEFCLSVRTRPKHEEGCDEQE